MDLELLVYLIMLPIYMIGFVMAGCWGYREKSGEPALYLMHEISFDVSSQDSTQKTVRELSDIAYFHTDTQSVDTIKSCYRKMKQIMESISCILEIYSLPLLNALDYISDISTAFFFLSKTNTRLLGIYSLLVISSQRIFSAIILGDHYGWETGVRQLFDLEVLYAVYTSVKRERAVLQIIQIKILEGFLESFPQLLFTSYYLVKRSKNAEENVLIHISLILSLLSLSKAWIFSDSVAVPQERLSCCTRVEIHGEYCNAKVRNVADDNDIWDRLLHGIRVSVIRVWRFGEISVTVSLIVGSANVVSARGTVSAFFVVLFTCYFIQSLYPDTKKSSWFYWAIQKNRLQLASEAKSTVRENSDCGVESQAKTGNNRILILGSFLRHATILTVLYFAELNYFFWALPTFSPKKFVVVYYIWKVILLIILLTACLVSEAGNSLVMIFDTLLYYFVIGLFSFVSGGIIAWFFVIDTEQYTKAIEADPSFLLKMIKERKYTFIEKVMRSGVCSTHRLIEDAISWMFENQINPNDEDAIASFVEDQPFCKLIYFLIKYQFVETGNPIRNISHLNVEDPKYYNHYAVPALVYKCNFGRMKTLRSRLASSILSKLLTKSRCVGGIGLLSSYEAIMEAGASLHFVRYHLNAPEGFFQKYGRFNCTAQQLYDNGFDLLFCLRANFKTEELILAGYNLPMLNNKAVLERDENGECYKEREHLIRLKESGFEGFFDLNFTPEDLCSTNLFEPHELLEYNCNSINRTLSLSDTHSSCGNELGLNRIDAGYKL